MSQNQSQSISESLLRLKKPPEPWAPPNFEPLYVEQREAEPSLPQLIQSNDPLAIFKLFYSDTIIQQITQYTNEYALILKTMHTPKQRHRRPWYPITTEEIHAFIGIYIYMGVNRQPTISEY